MRLTRMCNGLAYWSVRHPYRPNLYAAKSKRHLKRIFKMSYKERSSLDYTLAYKHFPVYCKIVRVKQSHEEKSFKYTKLITKTLIFPVLYSFFASYILMETRQFDPILDPITIDVIRTRSEYRREQKELSEKFLKYQ